MVDHILPFEPNSKIRLMYEDEAGFGRISDPTSCWCFPGCRPIVPYHHIREYRYAYGAVEPQTGDSFFLILPNCDTVCMNVFLKELSEAFANDYILLATDNAVWHKSKGLEIPENIRLFFLPARTPELNPIEQVWKDTRKRGFKNKIFSSLEKVIDKLCDTITSFTKEDFKRITGRQWILQLF